MGNHDAGQSAVRTAEAILTRRTTETALAILDEACGPLRNHYHTGSGCDAEFDDAVYPDTAFGALLIEAFAPGETFEPQPGGDDDCEWEDRHYERVIAPFRVRYNLR
jgi:hypothetical protein